jgi:phosphoketolase
MLGRGTLEREREPGMLGYSLNRPFQALSPNRGWACVSVLSLIGEGGLLRRSFLSNNNTKPNQTEAINAVGLAAAS